jgi:flagella basal body P-ring formation protein FlgA
MKIIQYLLLFLLSIIQTVFAEDSELLLVKEALKGSLSEKVKKLDVEYDYQENLANQVGNPSFVRVTRVAQKYGAFNAKIYYTDNSIKDIAGRYRAYSEVPMAKRYIKRGEVLSESDLEPTNVDITHNEQNIIGANDQVVGLQAKRDLQPGRCIRNTDLKLPTVIEEKDEVTLIYKTKSIEVKATGQALKSGAIGDHIKVKNTRSNKTISGVVVNKGVVQVNRENHE